MKRTLVAAFGSFLEHDMNSTEQFLKQLPSRNNLFTTLLPVGYFKKDFIIVLKGSFLRSKNLGNRSATRFPLNRC